MLVGVWQTSLIITTNALLFKQLLESLTRESTPLKGLKLDVIMGLWYAHSLGNILLFRAYNQYTNIKWVRQVATIDLNDFFLEVT